MNNYINKFSHLCIEQRNYLSGILVKGHIYNHISISKQSRPFRQLLQELPDLGLHCLLKHKKVSQEGKGLTCTEPSMLMVFVVLCLGAPEGSISSGSG